MIGALSFAVLSIVATAGAVVVAHSIVSREAKR